MARGKEHPKKTVCLARLVAGESPKIIAETEGVPIETVRTWSKSLKKPNGLAPVQAAVEEEGQDVGNLLGRMMIAQVEAQIAVMEHVTGKKPNAYLAKQNIADIGHFSGINVDKLIRLGEMAERAKDLPVQDDVLDTEGRDV